MPGVDESRCAAKKSDCNYREGDRPKLHADHRMERGDLYGTSASSFAAQFENRNPLLAGPGHITRMVEPIP